MGPESPVHTGVRTPEQPARSESPHWPVRYYKMTTINNNRLTLLMSVNSTRTNATCSNKNNTLHKLIKNGQKLLVCCCVSIPCILHNSLIVPFRYSFIFSWRSRVLFYLKKSPTQLLPVECYKTDFVNNVLATVLSLALRHTHTHTTQCSLIQTNCSLHQLISRLTQFNKSFCCSYCKHYCSNI